MIVSRSFCPGHDQVHETVLEQELGSLEALGELLADRPGRHPRASEANQRLRLGDHDVPQHANEATTPPVVGLDRRR